MDEQPNGRGQSSQAEFRERKDAELKAISRGLGHDLKPAAELTNREIVSEARELQVHFQQLADRYEQAPASQRTEICEEMQPFVNRERELRQEYSERSSLGGTE